MQYIVFDTENKKLILRDNITTIIDRCTFGVKNFNKTESVYIFELEPHPKLKSKLIYFPVQNTTLTIL